ncbi:MAG: Ig-like domain repeat protein [Acidimicrobiia bacterium]|nr:Ig-like domain repeat protein [Acidimicrobiia bacterium]
MLKRWVATMSGTQSVTQAQAVTDAQEYDVIVANKRVFTPYLSAMHAANPDLKVVGYMNGAYAQHNQGPTSGAYDPSWYAKDSGGHYITSGDFGNWLMDVTNPGWIQDRKTACAGMLSDGYDGCYLDVLGNADVDPGYVSGVPVNPATGQPYTASQWMTDTANLGTQVKSANSAGFIVGNGLQDGNEYFTASEGPTSKLLGGLDGGNAQGWLRGPTTPIDKFENLNAWEQDVSLLVDAGSHSKSAMAMTKVWTVSPTPTQDQIDAVHRYALASFLLGTDGNQYFLFDSDPNDGAVAADHPYDHVNVGTPTEASPCNVSTQNCAADASGAYVRHFTDGVAVVNPCTPTPRRPCPNVTYALGAPMTNLEGQTVAQVTLGPDTGDVFTTEFGTVSLNPSSVPPNGTSTSTVTATLTDGHGNGVPGRPVTFTTSGDAVIGPVTDHGDGTYTATITASTTPGDQTITAHDGALGASATLHETWPTTTSLTSSKTATSYGSSVTFTVSVSSPGGGVPTGTVTFLDNGSTFAAADLNGSGQAQLSTAALAVGSHTITAAYPGDATHQQSASAPLMETVSKAATTTVLTSAPNPSSYGSSVNLNVAVTSSGGTPTGTVTFTDGSNPIGNAPVDGTGHAQLSTSSLSVGRHTLGASYSGDGNFNASTAGSLSQTVNKAATSTALGSSSNPASYGSPVTITATVSSPGGTPAGTVTFKSGSTTLGTATLDASGTAQITKTFAKVSNPVTALYAGNINFAASTSAVLTQTQNNAPATVALSTSSSAVTAPSSVTFTASVTSTAGTPTGTVQFMDAGSPIGNAVPIVSGNAKLTIPLAAGGHVITAVYSGDASFSQVTSGALFQKVNRSGAKSSTTSVVSTPNPSRSTQTVTITATVTAGATGTAWLFDGSNMILSTTLDGTGHATFTTSALSVGSHSLKVGYSGDGTFNPSISNAKTQTVNP